MGVRNLISKLPRQFQPQILNIFEDTFLVIQIEVKHFNKLLIAENIYLNESRQINLISF